jgi:hypothetical protein
LVYKPMGTTMHSETTVRRWIRQRSVNFLIALKDEVETGSDVRPLPISTIMNSFGSF